MAAHPGPALEHKGLRQIFCKKTPGVLIEDAVSLFLPNAAGEQIAVGFGGFLGSVEAVGQRCAVEI